MQNFIHPFNSSYIDLFTGKGLQNVRKLKVLRLDNNRLSKIDYREIGCCSQLTVLDISCNDIQDISVSLNLRLEKDSVVNQSRSCRNKLLLLLIIIIIIFVIIIF